MSLLGGILSTQVPSLTRVNSRGKTPRGPNCTNHNTKVRNGQPTVHDKYPVAFGMNDLEIHHEFYSYCLLPRLQRDGRRQQAL